MRLSAHIVKFFIFLSDSIFHGMNICENIFFDLDKKRFGYECLKT